MKIKSIPIKITATVYDGETGEKKLAGEIATQLVDIRPLQLLNFYIGINDDKFRAVYSNGNWEITRSNS